MTLCHVLLDSIMLDVGRPRAYTVSRMAARLITNAAKVMMMDLAADQVRVALIRYVIAPDTEIRPFLGQYLSSLNITY